MAVLVQEIINADYAFVIHTTNPSSGDSSEIYAEVSYFNSSFGLVFCYSEYKTCCFLLVIGGKGTGRNSCWGLSRSSFKFCVQEN